MSLWTRLLEGGKRLFEPDSSPEPAADGIECAPDPNDVGFTAAVVGLGAKLAMADGAVTDQEIMVFSRVFRAAPEDADNVRRVFNIARQTVRGYESYASVSAASTATGPAFWKACWTASSRSPVPTVSSPMPRCSS